MATKGYDHSEYEEERRARQKPAPGRWERPAKKRAIRDEYKALLDALDQAAAARDCIGQNRGMEKEQAREGYECAVSEELVPVLLAAVEIAADDMDARDVERLAEAVVAKLRRAKLIED